MNLYNVFGLNIQSAFKLDELIQGNHTNQPKLVIFPDNVKRPANDQEDTFYSQMQILNQNFFYLTIKDQADFLVTQEDGVTKIKVDLMDGHDWPYTKSWLYGSVLTAALQMNNRFAIHASAVLHQEKLYLFCGQSGIGKSTIASQLHTKGYPLFSDDKCVLHYHAENEKYYSYPSLKIARLWDKSSKALSDDSFIHSPAKVALKANKYQFLLDDTQVIQESKEVHSIYRIYNGEEDSKLLIRQPSGFNKIKQLRNQTHRLNYVYKLGKQKIHWVYMSQIVQNIPFFVINRPEGTSIADFVDFVVEKIIIE